eukprot:2262371-Alexandrium_andersonii.AAC.1
MPTFTSSWTDPTVLPPSTPAPVVEAQVPIDVVRYVQANLVVPPGVEPHLVVPPVDPEEAAEVEVPSPAATLAPETEAHSSVQNPGGPLPEARAESPTSRLTAFWRGMFYYLRQSPGEEQVAPGTHNVGVQA